MSAPKGKLQEMAIRGRDYRDEYEFEMMGEDVTALLSPLPDKKFLPISAFLKAHLDMDEEEAVEKVEEAKEEAKENGEDSIDISKMDKEFVAALQRAAIFGIKGSYDDDGEVVEYDEEEARAMVEMMVGGYSVELGGKVLEISGDVRDATEFRGSRGSI
ncbi:tail assembly chaperone [Halorubrum tailed virus 25]|uniref:Tail assembly chaperone n=1 Tax=Halorubrum tailed virus 25 TaxID=2878006 RepID=A0AAE8XXN2_9CAUD|nr:tail assembly chaperone [Halorubrum tailed virus 25]UBF22607.1 tail assembly chaperone [Halorubrum tailed virus 25]